jgi:hypothetical protein
LKENYAENSAENHFPRKKTLEKLIPGLLPAAAADADGHREAEEEEDGGEAARHVRPGNLFRKNVCRDGEEFHDLLLKLENH